MLDMTFTLNCIVKIVGVILCFVANRVPSLCFFFSSRRRHTRSLCDWSSDVCSSDLGSGFAGPDLQRATVERVIVEAGGLVRRIRSRTAFGHPRVKTGAGRGDGHGTDRKSVV